jgi:hypothetical protein
MVAVGERENLTVESFYCRCRNIGIQRMGKVIAYRHIPQGLAGGEISVATAKALNVGT